MINRYLYTGPQRWLSATGKGTIALDIATSQTNAAVSGISAAITMPLGMPCPEGTYKADDGRCIADSIDSFDVAGQLDKIFANSNIGNIANISVLNNWKFWESVAFWAVFGFTAWFLLSIRYVIKHYSAYDIVEKLEAKHKKRKMNFLYKLIVLVLTTHPMFSIYFHNDEKLNKLTRLILYYTRAMLVLTYSSIFSGLGTGNITMKVYCVILNIVLISPVHFLLSIIVQWSLNSPRQTKPIIRKLKVVFGMSFLAIILGGLIVIIFILVAQNSGSDQVDWTINFLMNIATDLIFTPILGLTSQVFLLRASGSNFIANIAFLSIVIAKVINSKVKGFYNKIFKSQDDDEHPQDIREHQSDIDQSMEKDNKKRGLGEVKQDAETKEWILRDNTRTPQASVMAGNQFRNRFAGSYIGSGNPDRTFFEADSPAGKRMLNRLTFTKDLASPANRMGTVDSARHFNEAEMDFDDIFADRSPNANGSPSRFSNKNKDTSPLNVSPMEKGMHKENMQQNNQNMQTESPFLAGDISEFSPAQRRQVLPPHRIQQKVEGNLEADPHMETLKGPIDNENQIECISDQKENDYQDVSDQPAGRNKHQQHDVPTMGFEDMHNPQEALPGRQPAGSGVYDHES